MLLPTPSYSPVFPFNFGHVQTLFPTLFRKTPVTTPQKRRIKTEDNDFIDVDFHKAHGDVADGVKRLIVVSHGLEGNARKKYSLGMAAQFTEMGCDVICLNFRGCSGEPNHQLRMYHSGATDDLHQVIGYGLDEGGYEKVGLIGFSMGGNQTLKYLGEDPGKVFNPVKAAVVFSVPCVLGESVDVMTRWQNRLYMQYFMRGLKAKVREKAKRFPDRVNIDGLDKMITFRPFDNKYTAPIHGFKDAEDYYTKCSSKQFLSGITIPTLLVQAADDPFLSESCYPIEEAEKSQSLFLEVPPYGGHVGFVEKPWDQSYWSERRAATFFKEHLFCSG